MILRLLRAQNRTITRSIRRQILLLLSPVYIHTVVGVRPQEYHSELNDDASAVPGSESDLLVSTHAGGRSVCKRTHDYVIDDRLSLCVSYQL